MRGREARHLSHCMQPSQPRMGPGICLHYGTGNMWGSSGEANGSYCPQRGSSEVEWLSASASPHSHLPWACFPTPPINQLHPGLCHPCESASPDPSNTQLWIPGHHKPQLSAKPLVLKTSTLPFSCLLPLPAQRSRLGRDEHHSHLHLE